MIGWRLHRQRIADVSIERPKWTSRRSCITQNSARLGECFLSHGYDSNSSYWCVRRDLLIHAASEEVLDLPLVARIVSVVLLPSVVRFVVVSRVVARFPLASYVLARPFASVIPIRAFVLKQIRTVDPVFVQSMRTAMAIQLGSVIARTSFFALLLLPFFLFA